MTSVSSCYLKFKTKLPCRLGCCRKHQLLLYRGIRLPPPPTSVLDMTLNNLMVRHQ